MERGSSESYEPESDQLGGAPSQVALELGRDGLTAGLGELSRILLLFQRGDILGHLGVLRLRGIGLGRG